MLIGNFSYEGTEFVGIVFSDVTTSVIAHEVAHQWFYGSHVANRYNGVARKDDFLNEVRRLAPSYDIDGWATLVGLR